MNIIDLQIQVLNHLKESLKKDSITQDLFKKYQVDLNELDHIVICFKDLDVSARTAKGIIYLNNELWKPLLEQLKSGIKIEDLNYSNLEHYTIHEITHILQQTTGDSPTQGSTEDSYLDNPFEQEGFQIQTEYLSEHFGDETAENYIEQVLDHHDVDGKEREEKKDELLSVAFIKQADFEDEINNNIDSIMYAAVDLKINLDDILKSFDQFQSEPKEDIDDLSSYSADILFKNFIRNIISFLFVIEVEKDLIKYIEKLFLFEKQTNIHPQINNKIHDKITDLYKLNNTISALSESNSISNLELLLNIITEKDLEYDNLLPRLKYKFQEFFQLIGNLKENIWYILNDIGQDNFPDEAIFQELRKFLKSIEDLLSILDIDIELEFLVDNFEKEMLGKISEESYQKYEEDEEIVESILSISNLFIKYAGLLKFPSQMFQEMSSWGQKAIALKTKEHVLDYLSKSNKIDEEEYEKFYYIHTELSDAKISLENEFVDRLVDYNIEYKNTNLEKYVFQYTCDVAKYGDDREDHLFNVNIIINKHHYKLKNITYQKLKEIVDETIKQLDTLIEEASNKLKLRPIDNWEKVEIQLIIKLCDELISQNSDFIYVKNKQTVGKIFNYSDFGSDPQFQKYKVQLLLFFDEEYAKKVYSKENWAGLWKENENPEYNAIWITAETKNILFAGFKQTLNKFNNTLRHELQHLFQSAKSIEKNIFESDYYGLPSKKIRNPEADAFGILKDKEQKVEHSLRDIEFYTDLTDAVETFKSRYNKWPNKLRNIVIKLFVGEITKNDLIKYNLTSQEEKYVLSMFYGTDHFFQQLKRLAPGKWQKAVKEFYKAINADFEIIAEHKPKQLKFDFDEPSKERFKPSMWKLNPEEQTDRLEKLRKILDILKEKEDKGHSILTD